MIYLHHGYRRVCMTSSSTILNSPSIYLLSVRLCPCFRHSFFFLYIILLNLHNDKVLFMWYNVNTLNFMGWNHGRTGYCHACLSGIKCCICRCNCRIYRKRDFKALKRKRYCLRQYRFFGQKISVFF